MSLFYQKKKMLEIAKKKDMPKKNKQKKNMRFCDAKVETCKRLKLSIETKFFFLLFFFFFLNNSSVN